MVSVRLTATDICHQAVIFHIMTNVSFIVKGCEAAWASSLSVWIKDVLFSLLLFLFCINGVFFFVLSVWGAAGSAVEFRLGFSYLSPDRQARNGTNQAAVLKELQTWFIYTHLQSLSAHRSVSMQRVFLHKCSARAVQQELLQRGRLFPSPPSHRHAPVLRLAQTATYAAAPTIGLCAATSVLLIAN